MQYADRNATKKLLQFRQLNGYLLYRIFSVISLLLCNICVKIVPE